MSKDYFSLSSLVLSAIWDLMAHALPTLQAFKVPRQVEQGRVHDSNTIVAEPKSMDCGEDDADFDEILNLNVDEGEQSVVLKGTSEIENEEKETDKGVPINDEVQCKSVTYVRA